MKLQWTASTSTSPDSTQPLYTCTMYIALWEVEKLGSLTHDVSKRNYSKTTTDATSVTVIQSDKKFKTLENHCRRLVWRWEVWSWIKLASSMFFQAMYHFSSFHQILKTHFWTFAITRNRKTFIFWWWLNVSCCKGRWFWCSCVIVVRKGVCLWSFLSAAVGASLAAAAAVGASLLRQQLASVRPHLSCPVFCHMLPSSLT